MAMRISVTGDKNPFGRWRWQDAAGRWASEVEPVARGALRARAPVAPVNGGRLRDSIHSNRHLSGSAVRLEFGSDVPYARFVVEGTQPHTITARNARALRWVDRGGQTRFARQVRHPGTKPNRFAERAIRPLMPFIQQRFETVVRSQLRP